MYLFGDVQQSLDKNLFDEGKKSSNRSLMRKKNQSGEKKEKKKLPFRKMIFFLLKKFSRKVIYKSGFDIHTDLSKFKATYR